MSHLNIQLSLIIVILLIYSKKENTTKTKAMQIPVIIQLAMLGWIEYIERVVNSYM